VPESSIDHVAVRLGKIAEMAERGGPSAAQAMGHQLVREVTRNELIRYTHPAGARTSSPPGQPPAIISGNLRRSIKQEPIAGGRPVGRYRWETTVGGTVVYARIQELGGWAGRNHSTYLPRRPYLSAAVLRSRSSIRDAGVDAFKKAVGL
jgi:phage gpG-like protein